MSKKRTRRTKAETEALRGEIFDLRQRGYSLREIGKRLGISHQLANHHLARFCAEAGKGISAKTAQELILEAILRARHERAYVARQRDQVKSGQERLAWTNTLLRVTQRLDELLLHSRLCHAPDLEAIRARRDVGMLARALAGSRA